jgi:hypothetical protein
MAPAFAAFSLASLPARAQSYQLESGGAPFSSIVTTGTSVALTDPDDGFGEVAIDFPFAFFGQTVAGTTLYASSNGLLLLFAPSTSPNNASIPDPAAPNGFIAPFWDDLYVGSNAGVYSEIQGAAPDRVLVVEWANVSPYSARSQSISFQARLHESGVIELIYGDRSSGGGWSGTIGIEDATGSNGVSNPCVAPARCVPADVPSGTLIRFVPSGSAELPDLDLGMIGAPPPNGSQGQTFIISYVVDNSGLGDSTTPTSLGIFGSTSSTWTPSATQLGSSAVAPIAAGANVAGQVSFTLPVGVLGPYALFAVVDPANAVMETDKINNVVSLGSIDISASLVITTASLPLAELGHPYSAAVAARGGTPPYTFTFDCSRCAPAWLMIDPGGNLRGTPQIAGAVPLIVDVHDAAGARASSTLEIDVTTSGAINMVSSLPDATVGQSYAQAIVSGGSPPYQISVTAGALPPGLSASSDGSLSGTPSSAGAYQFTLSIGDSSSPPSTAEGALSLAVSSAGSTLHITSPSDITLYLDADTDDDLTVQGGMPPYVWSLISGSLPPGIMLDGANGKLIGRVVRVGTSTVMVEVKDASGDRDRATLHVHALAQAPMIGPNGSAGHGCSCRAEGQGPRSGAAIVWILSMSLCLRAKQGWWSARFARGGRRSWRRSDRRLDRPRSSKP